MYIYKYLDDWEKLSETFLHAKEDFCSSLKMEHMTDADHPQAKGVCLDFKINTLGDYYDF